MEGRIYELDIDPATEYSNMKKAIITPEEMRNGFNWDKKWEEHCLCNTCEKNCFDKDVIVSECGNYKEVKGERC